MSAISRACNWCISCTIKADYPVNSLRPRQNGRHFAEDIFNRISLNENVWIPIKISLKFVPKGPINNIAALVQIMAWPRPGDKPLSEPRMVSLPTHICVTLPQWVKAFKFGTEKTLRGQPGTGLTFHCKWWPKCADFPKPVLWLCLPSDNLLIVCKCIGTHWWLVNIGPVNG